MTISLNLSLEWQAGVRPWFRHEDAHVEQNWRQALPTMWSTQANSNATSFHFS
jgi:hypothetical protein